VHACRLSVSSLPMEDQDEYIRSIAQYHGHSEEDALAARDLLRLSPNDLVVRFNDVATFARRFGLNIRPLAELNRGDRNRNRTMAAAPRVQARGLRADSRGRGTPREAGRLGCTRSSPSSMKSNACEDSAYLASATGMMSLRDGKDTLARVGSRCQAGRVREFSGVKRGWTALTT
jgi:hypothetical protein